MNQTITTEFLPDAYAEGKRILTFRKVFNQEIYKYFKEHPTHADVLMLLCPAYPYENRKFTFAKGQNMTGEMSPTLPHFLNQTDSLAYQLHSHGFNLNNLFMHPLVSDVDINQPAIVNQYAHGDTDFFDDCARSSAIQNHNVLCERYPEANIVSSTFFNGIPGLESMRSHVFQRMKYLLDNHLIPVEFMTHLSNVASSTSPHIAALYGGNTFEAAFHKMCDFLTITLGIAQQFPEGCVVFNTATSSSQYLKNDALLKATLGVDPVIQLPIFRFF